MSFKSPLGRVAVAALVAGGVGLLLPALASAHARISPAVSVAGKLQLYSLAVPTEKSGLTTSTIVMTVPVRVRDRFVRAAAGRMAHAAAADRLG